MRLHVRVMVPLLAVLGGCEVDPTTASLRNAIVGMDGGGDGDDPELIGNDADLIDAPDTLDDPPDDPDAAGEDGGCPMCCELDGRMTVCPCHGGGPPDFGDVCTTEESEADEDDGVPWAEWCEMLRECDHCEWLRQCRPLDWRCRFADECLGFVTPTCPRSPVTCPAFAHAEERGPPRGVHAFQEIITRNFRTPWIYLVSGAALGCDALTLGLPLLVAPTPLTVGIAVGAGVGAIVFTIASIIMTPTTETNLCSCSQEYDLWGKALRDEATEMVSADCWRCKNEACTERGCSTRGFADGCGPGFENTEEIHECCHDNFMVDTLENNPGPPTTCVVQENPTTSLGVEDDCLRWLEYRCNSGQTPYRCGSVIRCAAGPSSMCVAACQQPGVSCTALTGPLGCTTVERLFCPPGCFEAGTPITMADGSTKPIEQIRESDLVLSYDVDSGATTPGVVERTFVHEKPLEPTIVINGTLRATRNHPFYRDGAWVTAGDLRFGDQLLIATNPRTVERHRIEIITIEPPADVVYNLEVAGQHNYFAGGVLAHNKP